MIISATTALPALAASFAGSPATSFEASGTDVARDGAPLGLRLVKSRAEAFTFYLDVSAELDRDRTNGMVQAGLQRLW